MVTMTQRIAAACLVFFCINAGGCGPSGAGDRSGPGLPVTLIADQPEADVEFGVSGKAPTAKVTLQGRILEMNEHSIKLHLQDYMLSKFGRNTAIGWNWRSQTNTPKYRDETRELTLDEDCAFYDGSSPLDRHAAIYYCENRKPALASVLLRSDGKVGAVNLRVKASNGTPPLNEKQAKGETSQVTSKKITVGEGQTGSNVKLTVGDLLSLRLNVPVSARAQWEIFREEDLSLIRQEGDARIVRTGLGFQGSEEVQVLNFRALQKGRAVLNLVYERLFDNRPEVPSRTFSITVNVVEEGGPDK